MAYFNHNNRSNDRLNNKNVQRAQQQIRYHQPLQRLQRRSKFQRLMKSIYGEEADILRKDNFLLFDAMVKRGGFNQVCARNRWEEINISMQYDKKMWGLTKYYEEVLLAHEEWLMDQMECYSSVQHQFIQMHLLAPNNLTAAYYQLTPVEYMFAESNFFSLDEYYNIKTIALFQNQIPLISAQYADKFMILRRRLLFTQQLKQSIPAQLKNYGIAGTENKVIVVGLSFSSLVIADKLSQFGVKVVIFDKSRNQKSYTGQKQIVDLGLTLLEGHKGQGSYYSYLTGLDVSLEQFSGVCGLLDEQGKLISDQKIRVSQQHFLNIIEELRGEVMSRKKLYEEIVSRVMRRKLQHQKPLIRWHYDRYILFNRLKGQHTTVADLCTYQSKKFAKHITQPFSIVSLRSLTKLYERVKQKKNVEIVNQTIQKIAYNDGFWSVYSRNDSHSGKYLIYADQQSACKCVLEGNPKIADIGSDIMGESISVLQQLTVLKYINCQYTFRDKLSLKDSLKGMNCFTLNSIHGYIYYFILPSQNQLLAVLRCYHHTSINYNAELLAIFENRCMAKVNKIVGDEVWSYDYSFSLKDQKYIESLIRIKPNQKMYFMLPITSTHCSHPLQTQIDITTHISTLILEQIYPNYTYYIPSLKGKFKSSQSIAQSHIKSESIISNVQEQTAKPILVTQINNAKSNVASQHSINKMQVELQQQSIQSQPRLLTGKSKKQAQVNIQMLKVKKKLFKNQEQYDIFGHNNEKIKAYQLKMQSKFNEVSSNNEKVWNGDIGIQWLESQWIQGMKLNENVRLYSAGQPYLKRKDLFSQSLGIEQDEIFYALDQMVTRREHLSFRNRFKTTTYYQTVLVINSRIFYCIADENQPKTIYYHTILTSLLIKLNQAVSKLREQKFQQNPAFKNSVVIHSKINTHPPKCLAPSVIIKIIQQELQTTTHSNIDDLLQEKLNETLRLSQNQRFMGVPQEIQHTSPSSFTNNVLIGQLLDVDARLSIILAELTNFRDKLSVLTQLKQFSLFQLFFGVLNQQYICCQIMNRFGPQPYSYQQIQQQDLQLCQQIRQVFSKNVVNQLYSMLIATQQGAVVINRNFMERKRQHDFQPYTYVKQHLNQTIKHYLIVGKHKIQFLDKEQILVYILKSLVINYHISQITKHFQQLIKREVKMQSQLSPKLKLFYRMTKKCIKKEVSNVSLNRFAEKVKDLGENDKHALAQLMMKNNIKWVENDFVYITK